MRYVPPERSPFSFKKNDGLLPLQPNRYRVQEELDNENFDKFEAALQKKEEERKKARKLGKSISPL